MITQGIIAGALFAVVLLFGLIETEFTQAVRGSLRTAIETPVDNVHGMFGEIAQAVGAFRGDRHGDGSGFESIEVNPPLGSATGQPLRTDTPSAGSPVAHQQFRIDEDILYLINTQTDLYNQEQSTPEAPGPSYLPEPLS
jgi:hypothetical protein